MKPVPKNIAASVRAKLLNLSKERNEDFTLTLVRYVSERFLYRLGRSSCRQRYVLKGAMLLAMTLEDLGYRPTRDIDLLRNGPEDQEQTLKDFVAICSIDDRSDGLVFDAAHAIVQEIREHNRYHGTRVRLPATLGTARVTLQIDLGFGDAVRPSAKALTITTLLGNASPEVLSYPMEAVVAEKLEALVSIGMVTSRMKDFFDIYAVSAACEFSRPALIESIQATFRRRGTPLPVETPVVLSEALLNDPAKQVQWSAFVRRIERDERELPLVVVLSRVREFLRIVWDRQVGGEISTWTPGKGWH